MVRKMKTTAKSHVEGLVTLDSTDLPMRSFTSCTSPRYLQFGHALFDVILGNL